MNITVFRKKKLLFTSILVILLINISCKENERYSRSPEILHLTKAYESKGNIFLSKIAEHIEYIPLKTDSNFIIANSARVFIDKKYIVIIAFRQQLIFDRISGEFIREIGHYDQSPNGYRNTKFNLAYNEEKKTIYSDGWKNEIIEYSIDGTILAKITKPDCINSYRSFTNINDSTYISYVPNYSGKDSIKLVAVNSKGNLISIIPNHNHFLDNPARIKSWGDKEGWFYRYKENLFLKELFNDTIFELRGSNLFPKYVFDCGKNTPPYYNRDFINDEELQSYFWVQNLFESANYIFFTLSFDEELRSCIYDKKSNSVFVAHSKTVDSHYYNWEKFGFTNDLDNFLQFYPEYYNSNNEVISCVQAYEVKQWFKNNPEKAARLSPRLKKLKDIDENDNPVLMLVKLKE